MPYGLIAIFASVLLVLYFVFLTEASWIIKAVVSGIFIFCTTSFFGWVVCNPLVTLFLRVGLCVFIVFYRTYQQAKISK